MLLNLTVSTSGEHWQSFLPSQSQNYRKNSLATLGQVFTGEPINCEQGRCHKRNVGNKKESFSWKCLLCHAAQKPYISDELLKKGEKRGGVVEEREKGKSVVWYTGEWLIFPGGHESFSPYLFGPKVPRQRPEVGCCCLGKEVGARCFAGHQFSLVTSCCETELFALSHTLALGRRLPSMKQMENCTLMGNIYVSIQTKFFIKWSQHWLVLIWIISWRGLWTMCVC